MNQQTVVESQRVLAVLDDLLEDIKVLKYVPPSLDSFGDNDLYHLGSQSNGPDGETARERLEDHFELERRVEWGSNNEDMNFAHKNSIRELCDMLKHLSYGKAYAPQTEASDPLDGLLTITQILRTLMHDKFNSTVEEDLQKFQILRDTVSREQTASADVKALKRELKSEQNLRKVEVARRDQAIAKLTDEYKSIEDTALEDAKELERLTRDQQQIALQTYQKEEEELSQHCKQLEANLLQSQEKNNKEEAALRQERRKREQFLDGLLTQYDTEMTEKTEELNTLQNDYRADQEKMEGLEKDLNVFDEETAKRAQEERIENERKLHHMEILVRMETSAKLVQAFWRGFAVRALLKKKKAGKKKRKGKKGKKK